MLMLLLCFCRKIISGLRPRKWYGPLLQEKGYDLVVWNYCFRIFPFIFDICFTSAQELWPTSHEQTLSISEHKWRIIYFLSPEWRGKAATDGKSPLFNMNHKPSSLRSWSMAHSGMGVLEWMRGLGVLHLPWPGHTCSLWPLMKY